MQIVITVLSIAPDEFYDALAINAASASTDGLPFYGPVGGIRLALIRRPVGGVPEVQPARRGRVRPHCRRPPRRDKDGNEDVAIMMVEAEATEGELG